MRKLFFPLCLALVFLVCHSQSTSSAPLLSPPIEVIVIKGATLIDGSARRPVRNSVVIIKGDSIAAVGKLGQIKIPKTAQLIDARSLVLAPGFIDTHSHTDRGLDSDPLAATQVLKESQPQLLARMVDQSCRWAPISRL